MRTKKVINKTFKEITDKYDHLFRLKLRAAMEYRKLEQQDMARLCNKISANAVSKWVSLNKNHATSPSAPELLAIADVLRLRIDYFKEKDISCREADLDFFCQPNFIET